MINNILGQIYKINGFKILVKISELNLVKNVFVHNFNTNFISIACLVGTKLLDGRILILTIEEIYNKDDEVFAETSINGIYDSINESFQFGTDSYPIINENVFIINNDILVSILGFNKSNDNSTIGTYIYNKEIAVGYNPNILFGKHLGIFGNTGSGKTCTVVSLIQNYIRNNKQKNIKFIILDINGEYKNAFYENEAECFEFSSLRFHHRNLNNLEYGKLFRAAEGVQFPALKNCIEELNNNDNIWQIKDLISKLSEWIYNNATTDKYRQKETFSINQLTGLLRSMMLRIESILSDEELIKVIDNVDGDDTIETIKKSNKKVFILDLPISSDSLDIILYILFKKLYIEKRKRDSFDSHVCLLLEEAHRYIERNQEESKLGNYYIDKLAREGRKFGISLIISSQVPSMLSYEIISQCNSVIMHKITSKQDLEYLKCVMRLSSNAFYSQMSALEKQYAIVCGEAFPNDVVVKIHDANPLPNSNDPVIKDL